MQACQRVLRTTASHGSLVHELRPFRNASEPFHYLSDKKPDWKSKKVKHVSETDLDTKCDHLRNLHKGSSKRAAIRQKACSRNEKCGNSDISIVCLIKQEDHCNCCNDTEKQILKKNDDPQRTAFGSSAIGLNKGQANLLQAL